MLIINVLDNKKINHKNFKSLLIFFQYFDFKTVVYIFLGLLSSINLAIKVKKSLKAFFRE
jgi:hypothetical protein